MSAVNAEQTIKNSKIARTAIVVPAGTEVKIDASLIVVSSGKNKLELQNNLLVKIVEDEDEGGQGGKAIFVKPRNASKEARSMAGTYAALIRNMIIGVTAGFQKTLELKGVGYRAKVSGKNLDLTVGFSHPISHPIPEGITIETPNQTTIVIKGVDKQRVGQVAAEVRAYRPPENYKGKGIRYADEHIIIKETKK